MFANVPGVPATPPTYGLVASRAPVPTPDRWEQGLAWIPERCATTYQLAPWCAEPTEYTAPSPGAAYYRPVELRFADECSTLNGPVDYDRVIRIAESQTSFAVARELWNGAGSTADPYLLPGGATDTVNARLASAAADVVGSGGSTVRVGIGRLEQAAMADSGGQQVYLHVPIVVLPQLDGYATRVGNVLYTLAGNVVVADGGYPGTGPAGQAMAATAWAYATAPVAVFLSPVVIEDSDASTVDRATNTRTTWTSRVFAATWDPCVHLATELTI